MFNAIVILLFCAVMSLEFLVNKAGVLSGPLFVLIPELLSGVATVLLIGKGIAGRSINLDARYVVFLTALSLVLILGFVIESVSAGAIVSGLRSYLKYIPFFLLPAVHRFSKKEIRLQLMVLFGLLALQAPVAVYQRYFEFGGKRHTGDFVVGTVSTSGILTVLMVGLVATLVALFLRKRINLLALLVGFAIVLVPMSINETKATAILTPLAIIGPAIFMGQGWKSLGRLVPVLAVAAVGAIIFVQTYNSLVRYSEYGKPLESFFSEGYITDYLYTQAAEGKYRPLGRVDSLILAVRHISKDPLTMGFGLGAGNVSPSPLRGFSGAYADYYNRYGVGMTQVSVFLWEIGFVGLALYGFLLLFVLSDARLLARRSSEHAVLGQVWATMVVVSVLAFVYLSVFSTNEVGYLFWYFSGLVASEARILRREARVARSTSARHTGKTSELAVTARA